MKISKGKFRIVLLCVGLLFVLWLTFRNSKPAIMHYVRNNRAELTDFAENWLEKNEYVDRDAVYNGWDVRLYTNEGKVEFNVSSWGIAPASSYEGFFYSADDKLLGFQGEEVYFSEYENGWRKLGPGDNREYVEKIADNWYWFKASF